MDEQTEQIRRIIIEQISWDERLDQSKVHVDVKGRFVRLSGVVDSLDAWRTAWRSAVNVVGVAGVNNQLRIEYLPGLPATRALEIQRSFRLRENNTMGGTLW